MFAYIINVVTQFLSSPLFFFFFYLFVFVCVLDMLTRWQYFSRLYAADPKAEKFSKSRIYIIVGTAVAAVAVVLSLVTFIFWKYYYKGKRIRPSKAYLMRYLPCDLTSTPSHTSIYFSLLGNMLELIIWLHTFVVILVIFFNVLYAEAEESIVVSVSSDRATDFPYSEVCNATSNFSVSKKIGQGSYGSVYLGKLRGNVIWENNMYHPAFLYL